MLQLRNYQEECISAIHYFKDNGINRQLVSLPTGVGKTTIFSSLIKDLGKKTLIIAHTKELVEQAAERVFSIVGCAVGIVSMEKKEFEKDIIIACTPSATVNLEKLKEKNFDCLIWDECHHAATKNARKIIKELGFFDNNEKLMVGFTATPYRQDGLGLGEIFQITSYEKDIPYFIEKGYLVKPIYYKGISSINISRVKGITEENYEDKYNEYLNKPAVHKQVIGHYKEYANGKKAICFTTNIQHAINLAAYFKEYGISAKEIHSRIGTEERESILKEYRDGSLQVITNCGILTEGVDLPLTECVIIVRSVKSPGLFTQMVGRGLRPWINKNECIVIDFSEKDHFIKNESDLSKDKELKSYGEREAAERKELIESLPKNLNKELKLILIAKDILGGDYIWEKKGNMHILRGNYETLMQIVKQENYYRVCLVQKNIVIENLGKDQSFEMAFGIATDAANKNRHIFVLADKKASWRKLPITNKQKEILTQNRYKSGIHELNRGQAAQIITALIEKNQTGS